jgi:hypothetical protein
VLPVFVTGLYCGNRAEAEQSIRDRLASLRPLSLVEVEAQSDVAVEEHDAEAS